MRLIPFIALMLFCAVGYAQFPMVGSGRQVYSPDQVDSLFYWFDAQDLATITTTNNKVTAWNDKSGNGYHVLQADTSKAPTYYLSNPSYLLFDSINDYMQSASHWFGSDDLAIFIVAQEVTTQQYNLYLARRSSLPTNYANFQFYTSNNVFVSQFFNVFSSISNDYRWQSVEKVGDNIFLYSFTKNNTILGNKYINGYAGDYINTVNGTGDGTVGNGIAPTIIGSRANLDLFSGMKLFEIIVFTKQLTNAERQGIEAYLSSKYDLPLENKQKQPVISNRRIQPDYVDSLFYWFDATDASTITTNNNKVTQWADKGPFGYDVVQADTSKAPTYSATSGPGGTTAALTFDGTDDFLASASHWWGSDDLTIFVVMKFGNATRDASEVICGVYTSGGGISWLFTSGPTSLSYVLRPGWGSDGLTILTPTFSAKSTTYRSIAWAKDLLDGTDNTSPIDAYVDGSSQSVSPSTGINITSIFNQSVTPFSIAAGNITTTPSGFLQGSISEIIVFSRALTTSERRGIENYLNEKYNLW